MFGRIRNMNQVKIETEYEVLEHMIQDIPQFIQSEIDKLNEQISNDAKIVSENDQDIEVNMRCSDIRNYMIDILIEMKTYLYHAMIVMLYSYAETNMKDLSSNLGIKEDKCKIKRLYNRIKDNTNELPDIENY
jgi:glucosamine 6-phosphate synthetase-like amidotransferase/phosphosugar isomerase protein